MSRENHQDILIGTIAPPKPDYLRQVVEHGFECFELTFGPEVVDADLPALAQELLGVIDGRAVISSVGIYGNPLQEEKWVRGWEALLRGAKHFGANVVCGFAGALEDRPVDQSMDKFREVFGELARIAEGEGLKIAFENCDMGGTWNAPKWNIAHSPRAWEMMFDAVPSDALGLEWEPCHQMVSLIDPVPQLRKWVGKVHHLHGKDATVAWDVIEERGTRSGETYVWHRTPGFGDTNWSDVITILRLGGFRGAIDIEGWHDPVYRDELEMTGQVYALDYLRACRGGEFVPNPTPNT